MKGKKGSGKGGDNNTWNGLEIRIAFAWSGREIGQRGGLSPEGFQAESPGGLETGEWAIPKEAIDIALP